MENSEFDSFLFWRQPIAALDLYDLCDLGLTDTELTNQSTEREEKGRDLQVDQDLGEFSSFNFWRAPLVNVDALPQDLHLFL